MTMMWSRRAMVVILILILILGFTKGTPEGFRSSSVVSDTWAGRTEICEKNIATIAMGV